jgi:Zn ribbon nucleic-acid-binding protein
MTDKVVTTAKCPGCGARGRGQLWHDPGRTFQDLNCEHCRTVGGRVDKGVQHNER